MKKELIFIMALVCGVAFAASALAAPPFSAKWVITYNGYVQRDAQGSYAADTLIVVNNSSTTNNMGVWIEVFDKYGNPIPLASEGQTLFNGGSPLVANMILPNAYGWITLGMIIDRTTHDPWGVEPWAEKFSFRVSTGLHIKPPIVEVKQVIYNSGTDFPGEAIWQPLNIKTWAETCLGGLTGPGVTKLPRKYKWGNAADQFLGP
jgi:hypothetical protein